MLTPSTTEDPATRYNSMPPAWCAARLAEARAWASDVDADPAAARAHVIELLSQIDRPPLVAAAVGGAAGLLSEERLNRLRSCQQGAAEYTKDETGNQSQAKQYAEDVADLLAHIAALTARLTTEAADAQEAKDAAIHALLREWRDDEMARAEEDLSGSLRWEVQGLMYDSFNLKSQELTGKSLPEETPLPDLAAPLHRGTEGKGGDRG